jgi:hypothetical protein
MLFSGRLELLIKGADQTIKIVVIVKRIRVALVNNAIIDLIINSNYNLIVNCCP